MKPLNMITMQSISGGGDNPTGFPCDKPKFRIVGDKKIKHCAH